MKFIDALVKFWGFLSGKKTVIGGFLNTIAVWVDPQIILNTWIFGKQPLQEIIAVIGTLLLGGGLAHKGLKLYAARNGNGNGIKAALLILGLTFLIPLRASAQEMVDFNEILSKGRAGTFFVERNQKFAVLYTPIVADAKAKYISFNVGGSDNLETGEIKFLASISLRIDSFVAKAASSAFAKKWLSIAIFPPLEIAPAVSTSDFKKFIWGGVIAYKF